MHLGPSLNFEILNPFRRQQVTGERSLYLEIRKFVASNLRLPYEHDSR